MKVFGRVFYLLLILILPSCSKFMLEQEGKVKISFYPIGNVVNNETMYWYLYTADAYSNNVKSLRSGYLNGKTDTGRIEVTISNLNVGNYIFKYYKRDSIILNNIHVIGGKTSKYFLK